MVNCLLFLIAYRGSSLCFFRIPLYTLCLPSKFEKLLFSTVLEVSSRLRNIWKQQPMQTVFLTGDSKIENFGTRESLYCPLGQAWYSPLISNLCTVTGLKQSYHPMCRLDYQPLFGKMSPHSSPERVSFRGGSKTGPGRRRKSSLPYVMSCNKITSTCHHQ